MLLTASALHLASLYQLGKHPKQGGCDSIQRDTQRVRACAWKGLGREDGRKWDRNEVVGTLGSEGQCLLRRRSQEKGVQWSSKSGDC